MPFTQNYNSNAGGNNGMNQSDKKRTNFAVKDFYGVDGRLFISMWVADGGAYTIFMIKQEIGKDPSTGNSSYEQKAPKELPRVFLNTDNLRALLDGLTGNQETFEIAPKNGKLIISGNNSETFTIKIEASNGNRTVSFKGIPIGSTFSMATKQNIIFMIKIALKKALCAKLDPEEFGAAMGDDEEAPF